MPCDTSRVLAFLLQDGPGGRLLPRQSAVQGVACDAAKAVPAPPARPLHVACDAAKAVPAPPARPLHVACDAAKAVPAPPARPPHVACDAAKGRAGSAGA